MLKVHFLYVGKGNCTIIEHPTERISMIDINDFFKSSDDKDLTDPVKYFQTEFSDKGIFRFVLTHPDLDHMSGLNDLANAVSITNFWDTNNNKTIDEDSWEDSPYDKSDWDKYQKLRKSTENPKCLCLYRDGKGDYWTEDGISILSPTPELVDVSNKAPETDSQKYHHLSYVLMLEYKEKRILFGGDASIDVWDDILESCGSASLKADVFFAPHHGSPNNVNKEVFKKISPDYVVISVAEGVDYDYDYYHELAGKKVYSTKHYGTIVFTIKDDGTFDTILVDQNA
jgi:competence protein ComEC